MSDDNQHSERASGAGACETAASECVAGAGTCAAGAGECAVNDGGGERAAGAGERVMEAAGKHIAEAGACVAGDGFFESFVRRYPSFVLETLLCDRTTGKNIIWADDEYEALGEG